MASNTTVTPDTLITVKVLFEGENRRFRIPLKDLTANTLPKKLQVLLAIPIQKHVVFERYSDSSARYVVLVGHDQAVWKQLWRAAKAKLKLRLRVTAVPAPNAQEVKEEPAESLLDTDAHIPDATNDTKPLSPSPKREPDVIKAIINAQKVYGLGNMSEATLRPEPTTQVRPAMKKRDEDAPLPRAFVDNTRGVHKLTMLHGRDQTICAPLASFTVQCNNCNDNISNTHWHCSICENGDYDLCPNCIDFGVHCEIDNHFLIKRTIECGRVINSTMETAARKVMSPAPEKEIPGAFDTAPEESLPEAQEMTRTCNCCVNSMEESNFVTCLVCEDYDLCIPCHVNVKHGHHPSHAFEPVSKVLAMDVRASALCAPGRNMRHFAMCDGCDRDIYGVRHKCMNCPDFDYCMTCVKSAPHIHPGHRFVPIYDNIPLPNNRAAVHYSIRCDGPLCQTRMNFIRGDRYKCAVCDDVDFCANCEAQPTNPHNRTHPLIKFQTPIRNVMVTTYGERENGEPTVTMGDRISTRSQSTETTPSAPLANAATQVQTVAEVKPVEVQEEFKVKEEPKDAEPQATESTTEKLEVKEETLESLSCTASGGSLEAHFVADSISDGLAVEPGMPIEQTWTIRNPGPLTWPAGCCVRYIGGDYMLNVDSHRPSSLSDLDRAIQSNVIETPVAPGEEVKFMIKLRTPQRPGKAISYWRLKTHHGIPFGHKLWCDVNVNSPEPNAEPPKAESPKAESPKAESPKAESAKQVHESQMVFPTLDKESPVQSTHETSVEKPSVAPSTTDGREDLEEDLESLGIADDETDDCFLTDEEYEILDAETNEEAANGKK